MSGVFYTKKAKAKMRARRRKQQKASDGRGADVDGDTPTGILNGSNQRSRPPTEELADGGNSSSGKGGKRKRTADQISLSKPSDNVSRDRSNVHTDDHNASTSKRVKHTTTARTIIIPKGLTSKEAKKFRKDARRKARAQGQSEDDLKFAVEGREDEPSTEECSATKGKNGDNNGGDKLRKKKAKPSFPRINDLLTQHATQQKLAAKLSKTTSQNDALPPEVKSKYVAIDCEMVGVGIDGQKSALARASAVDWDGKVLLDTYVRVQERVTDFRTRVSGVRPRDISQSNSAAMSHEECRLEIGKLLLDKVLVGHALKNDLSALMLTHPREHVRDTARYKPFMRPSGRGGGKMRPRKLRDLVHEHLGKRIQVEGESHSSVEDARASMELFQSARVRWEKELDEKKKKKSGGGGSRGKK